MFHKMAKASILLIGICAFAVQGSVLRDEDRVLKRQARSPVPCDECDSPGVPAPPPPPPPPSPPGIPPVFHTEQWSGLTHSNGGQEVFSGAAASIDGGAQTGSQAFSLASAAGGDSKKEKTVAPELLSNRFGFDKDSDSFGQSSGGDSGFGGQSIGFGGGKKFSGNKSSFKESHFSIQSGDEQFRKGFGFKDGEFFHHRQFYKPGHGHQGFDGNGQTQGGFAVGSASQSSSYASSGRNNGDAGAIQFEGQNSDNRDVNTQFGQHSGSGFGGGSSSASSAFSGNTQQQQRLQLGSQNEFGRRNHHSGFGSTGQLEGGNSGYGSQDGNFGQSVSGYHSFGKSNGFSSNEQQQNLQIGSKRFESDGSSGIQDQGLGSSGQLEGGSSTFGSQNTHFGQSGLGYHSNGQSNRQQQSNAQSGQLHISSGFGAGSANSASSSSTGNQQQQSNLGLQTGFVSDGGSQSAGFASGSKGSQKGQQESSFNSFGKSNGFSDNGQQQQQQQLQLESQTGMETGAGSGQGGFASGSSSSSSSHSSGSSSGSYDSHQQEHSDLHTGLGGALQLAAQGLKQAQDQNSGCSTCGKSSYALSNAKSHSGSAIALSVAG